MLNQTNLEILRDFSNARNVRRARDLQKDAAAWLLAASKARANGARELALGLAELCADSASRCTIDAISEDVVQFWDGYRWRY